MIYICIHFCKDQTMRFCENQGGISPTLTLPKTGAGRLYQNSQEGRCCIKEKPIIRTEEIQNGAGYHTYIE